MFANEVPVHLEGLSSKNVTNQVHIVCASEVSLGIQTISQMLSKTLKSLFLRSLLLPTSFVISMRGELALPVKDLNLIITMFLHKKLTITKQLTARKAKKESL